MDYDEYLAEIENVKNLAAIEAVDKFKVSATAAFNKVRSIDTILLRDAHEITHERGIFIEEYKWILNLKGVFYEG